MKALVVTAADTLRSALRELSNRQLITVCAARRPDRDAAGDPGTATVLALRFLARRHQQITTEIDELNALIAPLTEAINPTLCALLGVGPDVAGQLLITAGENPRRLRSEAAFKPHPVQQEQPPIRPLTSIGASARPWPAWLTRPADSCGRWPASLTRPG
jgi:hypothetical protein